MIPVFLLSFREYIEAFLLITGCMIVCQQYGISRTKEIVLGASSAFVMSFFLTIAVYLTGNILLLAPQIATIGGWLLLIASFLITLIAFPIHSFLWQKIGRTLSFLERRITTHQRVLDWLMVLVVFLLVFKEGIEVLLFTASASLISDFIQSTLGLCLGLVAAGIVAIGIRYSFVYFHVDKLFWLFTFCLLLGITMLFQQGLAAVTNLSSLTTSLLAALYGAGIYLFFIKGKHYFIIPARKKIPQKEKTKNSEGR